MSWKRILADWKGSIPPEARRNDVETVIRHIFEKYEWNRRGSKIKVTDFRLLYYKNHINQNDRNIAIDGSFKIPTVSGRKIKGVYAKRILYMKEIVDYVDRILKGE